MFANVEPIPDVVPRMPKPPQPAIPPELIRTAAVEALDPNLRITPNEVSILLTCSLSQPKYGRRDGKPPPFLAPEVKAGAIKYPLGEVLKLRRTKKMGLLH
jgi:hypothetical protein